MGGGDPDALIEGAIHAAVGGATVLKEVLLEAVEAKFKSHPVAATKEGAKRKQDDVEMTG